MAKEVRIKHDYIQDTQTITKTMTDEFKKQGLDVHRHEVESLDDDYGTKERVLKIKNTQYYSVPDIPWHK